MGLLEGVRQGGMISKLSRTDLVGLLGKLVSIIELELFNCIRLGLEQYALPSGLYKERHACTPCIQSIIHNTHRKGITPN
jgi:hypothetical protein